MSNRSDALAFLNLISQYRQERQLEALKTQTEEATRVERDIELAARRQITLGRQQQQRQARVESIRQRVFEMNKDIGDLDTLLESPVYAQRDLAGHVAFRARSMGMALQVEGVVVENVPEYDDKERVDEMYARLAGVYKSAVARLSPERLEQMERAFQYRREIWRLRRFLELETKWRGAEPIRAALAPLYEEGKRTEAELEVVKAKPFFALGFGAHRARTLGKESERLRLKICGLQSQLGAVSEEELRELRQQFGQRDLEELKHMVERRTALIAVFEGAVECEEGPLISSASTARAENAEYKQGAGRALLPVCRPLGLFAVCNNRGRWYNGWDEYFRELVPHEPDYEEMLGGVDGEAKVVMCQIAKGAYFVLQTQDAPIIVLSRRLPVSFIGDEYHELHDKFFRVHAPTVGWVKNLNMPPKQVRFEDALTRGGNLIE